MSIVVTEKRRVYDSQSDKKNSNIVRDSPVEVDNKLIKNFNDENIAALSTSNVSKIATESPQIYIQETTSRKQLMTTEDQSTGKYTEHREEKKFKEKATVNENGEIRIEQTSLIIKEDTECEGELINNRQEIKFEGTSYKAGRFCSVSFCKAEGQEDNNNSRRCNIF